MENTGLILAGQYISESKAYIKDDKLCVDISTGILKLFVPYLLEIVKENNFSTMENSLVGKVAAEMTVKIMFHKYVSDFEFYPTIPYDRGIDYKIPSIRKTMDAKLRFENTSHRKDPCFSVSKKIIERKKSTLADIMFILTADVDSNTKYLDILKRDKITLSFEGFVDSIYLNKNRKDLIDEKTYYKVPLRLLNTPKDFINLINGKN